jgi:hypothetical protein
MGTGEVCLMRHCSVPGVVGGLPNEKSVGAIISGGVEDR